MNTKILSLIFILSILVFASCKKDKNNNQQQDITLDEQIEQLVYPLPTPFEVTEMLKSAGTPFRLDLTNDQQRVDSYMREASQALNLGVYGADLAYASTYNQAQSVRDLMNVSKKLSDNLGLTAIFDKDLLDRVENNIQNEDSIYKIVNNTYYDTYNRLQNENKGEISVLIIAGGWIESMYIATQLAITSENPQILMDKIAEQKYTLDLLIPLLEQYKDSDAVAELLPAMEQFKEIFDNVTFDEDENAHITQEDFDKLTELSKTERDKIVNMQ